MAARRPAQVRRIGNRTGESDRANRTSWQLGQVPIAGLLPRLTIQCAQAGREHDDSGAQVSRKYPVCVFREESGSGCRTGMQRGLAAIHSESSIESSRSFNAATSLLRAEYQLVSDDFSSHASAMTPSAPCTANSMESVSR